MTTQKDRQRVVDLIDQGHAIGDTVKTIVRRITEQMPHMTVDDIAQIATVHAEEAYLDAAVYAAQAKASKQIAEIIREVDQRCNDARHTLGEAYVLLNIWAQDGDTRAVELLNELHEATLVVGLEE